MDEEHGSWTDELREKLHHLEREIEECMTLANMSTLGKWKAMQRKSAKGYIMQKLASRGRRGPDGHHEMDEEHGPWTDELREKLLLEREIEELALANMSTLEKMEAMQRKSAKGYIMQKLGITRKKRIMTDNMKWMKSMDLGQMTNCK